MERGNEDAATKTPAGPAGWGGRICLLLLVALLIGAIAWNFDDLNALLKKFAAWANRDIVAGALVFIAIYGVGTVLFFPMSILTIAAGFVWGWLAVPLVIAGASVGMSLSFLVARYVLREWVQQRLSSNRKFAAVDKMVAVDGWTIVALLRLAPVVPFNVLNYALGVTGIRFSSYITASALCVAPGSVLFVYLGQAAASLDSIFSGSSGPGRATRIATLAVSGVVLLVLVMYVTARAKRALREAAESADMGADSDAGGLTG